MTNTRASRPIPLHAIKLHYESLRAAWQAPEVSFDQYQATWRSWLTNTSRKQLLGLEEFTYADFTQGTSQSFDMFMLRHSHVRTVVTLKGDFQYHGCIGKFSGFRTVDSEFGLAKNMAVIISLPFSGTGDGYIVKRVLAKCNELQIPVCLDLAYWGIAKDISLNLQDYPCIEEVVSSLSKPFYTLETHRVGIRFRKTYADDGISMQNEVKMQNQYSMNLGVSFMRKFGADWNWDYLEQRYNNACQEMKLTATNCVIFGLGGEEYAENNRGIPGVNRVCLSGVLAEV